MLYHAHSGLRYLILVVGAAVLVYAVWGWLGKRPYDRTMKGFASAFAGLLHLQILLGFALLVTGRYTPALIGHIFLMLLAAGAAQVVPSVMRRRPPEERTYLPHVVGTVVALALIVGGILAIGRGVFESLAAILAP